VEVRRQYESTTWKEKRKIGWKWKEAEGFHLGFLRDERLRDNNIRMQKSLSGSLV